VVVVEHGNNRSKSHISTWITCHYLIVADIQYTVNTRSTDRIHSKSIAPKNKKRQRRCRWSLHAQSAQSPWLYSLRWKCWFYSFMLSVKIVESQQNHTKKESQCQFNMSKRLVAFAVKKPILSCWTVQNKFHMKLFTISNRFVVVVIRISNSNHRR
jgi:hypothetical protein